MISRKVLLVLFVGAVGLAAWGLAGCIHGEHDDTPLTITTTSLPPGQAGAAYEATLEAIGGKWPYTWSIEESGSALPPGVYMSESGNLTGSPTTDGSYSFTVKVTDSDNNPRTATKNLTIVIYPELQVSITTAALLPAYVNEAYEGRLQAVGGELPYVWSIVAGQPVPSQYELTTGLYLSESGFVSGRPTTAGIYTVNVEVMENLGGSDTRFITITVRKPEEKLSIITPKALHIATQGELYEVYFAASGGVSYPDGTYRWKREDGSAPLPPGLGPIDLTSGLLSGTPTATGDYTFSVEVEDYEGTKESKIFELTVNP